METESSDEGPGRFGLHQPWHMCVSVFQQICAPDRVCVNMRRKTKSAPDPFTSLTSFAESLSSSGKPPFFELRCQSSRGVGWRGLGGTGGGGRESGASESLTPGLLRDDSGERFVTAS